MKVVIVGAGAIGLLIGSYASEQKHEVTYITRTTKQAENLNKEGITCIQPDGGIMKTKVFASTEFNQAPTDALWIIAVKYHHLSTLQVELNSLPETTALLFIQNGIAHLQWIAQFKHHPIYIATIEHGAMKKDSTTVVHKGIGVTKIAPYIKNTSQLDFTIFQSDSFQIELAEDAYGIVLRKAILNACINPITAILQIKNGDLLSNTHAFELMKTVFSELENVFPEISNLLTFEEVKALCLKTSKNNSSMLQDRLNRRTTEIEPIVGALIQLAVGRKKDLPVLRTLYHFVLAFDEKDQTHE
ncbi:2-dehydropantoate 2-reductase [Paenisporosarcina sp.]|uniref:2-dehydropantoate 2-reductase n=1 Tax=Paenisporosarcina sp. TaxID=1932001 RepID=UPI003C744B93